MSEFEEVPASLEFEADAAIAQSEFVVSFIELYLSNSRPSDYPLLPPRLAGVLNSIATGHGPRSRIVPCPYRTEDVEIAGSSHEPPPGDEVPQHMDALFAYLNNPELDTIHAAAYALWRLAWIHPFDDGNGRTARALCFVVYCLRARVRPDGSRPLPVRIADERRKYYRLLSEADAMFTRRRRRRRKRTPRLTNLEQFLKRLLREQSRDSLIPREP